MAEQQSPWRYVLIGCVVTIVLASLAVGGCLFLMVQWGREVSQAMRDPEVRRERVLEILGAESLPEGYHPAMALSVPMVMSTVILTGHEVPPGEVEGDLGDTAFIYLETVGYGQDEAALRAFFEGRTQDPGVLADSGIDVELDQIVARGNRQADGAALWYLVQRGDIDAQDFRGDGIGAVVLVDCPDDERRRFGIWFVPDPDPGAPLEELDLSGTPADPEAIGEFMGHFDLCR